MSLILEASDATAANIATPPTNTNGSHEVTQPTPAIKTLEAPPPATKTAACRQILLEYPNAETQGIIIACQNRWQMTVTSTDVHNAKASIKDAKEREKKKRQEKRQARAQQETSKGVPAVFSGGQATFSGDGAEQLAPEFQFRVAANRIGIPAARALLDTMETEARRLLGQA